MTERSDMSTDPIVSCVWGGLGGVATWWDMRSYSLNDGLEAMLGAWDGSHRSISILNREIFSR